MDTVSLGDLTKWNTNPLEPTIIGNKLYGRGASDMKSGLAAQAIALIELYNSGNCHKVVFAGLLLLVKKMELLVLIDLKNKG